MFKGIIECVVLHQRNLGLIYNFKSVSRSDLVRACILGFGPDLVGLFTILQQSPRGDLRKLKEANVFLAFVDHQEN